MVVAFWGGNGFGKTALSMETAVTIGELGKTVCIISAEDFCEMSLRFGKVFPPENSITEVIKEPAKIHSCSFEVSNNVFFIGPSYTDTALNLHFTGHEARNLLETAESIYDIVIVDCTTWKANAITGVALSKAKIIFIPIPAKTTAHMWFVANQQTLEQKAPIISYIQNKTTSNFDFETLFKSLPDVEPKAIVPYIPEYQDIINDGKLICRDNVSVKNAAKFKTAISSLIL